MSVIKVLALAWLLLVSAPASAARSDWRQLTVGHFRLYSTMRDSKTREVARQLQAFENTVGEFLRSQDRLPDVPTIIYILDGGDFLRYGAGRPGPVGVFYERPYDNVIVINGDISFDIVKVAIFHEYTHYIQRNSSTKKMPPWFVEGYAELFSGFKLNQDKVTIGGLPAGVGMYLDQWIPMERLLAVKQSDPEYRAERLAPQFYGESWALVHMLLFDDKSLLLPTSNYINTMDLGVPEPDAFAQAFPFDKGALDEAVHRLLKGRVIHLITVTYRQGVSIDDAPISPMTAAQADAEMARMALMIGWGKELIAPLSAAALKENPADPGVRALSARIAARDGQSQNIDDLAGALEQGGTDGAQLRIDVAATLLTQSQSKFAGDGAIAILNDLVHTEAAPLEAIALWAAAAQLTMVNSANMLPVLEGGSARAPHNTRLLANLAAVHERLGHAAKAREYYDRIILVSDNPQERLWAQKQSDSPRLRQD
jgi:hypothetical protein